MAKATRRYGRTIHGLALVLLALAWWPCSASADGACVAGAEHDAATVAQRVAALACRENRLWYRPFIDTDGRLASMTLAEAETGLLDDHATPAWLRVAQYWRGSGLMGAMAGFPGAATCARASAGSHAPPGCRAFLVDRPWSAAFVSYVLVHAGVPGFRPSPSHVDYVRDAWLRPDASPYRFADPDLEAPAVGDLLCFVRGASPMGHDGLRQWLADNPTGSLAMHCEVAVSAGGGQLRLVGGNVLQSVTMRLLTLNRAGHLWNLPRGSNASCSPDNPGGCSFSRQDWAVLLKLKPGIAAAPAPAFVPEAAPRPQCCVNCVVGSGVPRCAAGQGAVQLRDNGGPD